MTHDGTDLAWAAAGGGDLSFGGDTFGANKVIGANDAYSLSLETSGNTALTIDANGIITKPLQSCVLVHPAVDPVVKENITPGADHTVVFNVERFDQNGDFSSNTFTAPVTGRYLIALSLIIHTPPTASNYCQFKLTTSNKTYYVTKDPDQWDSSPAYTHFGTSIIADMDASDTYSLVYYEQGSHGAVTDISWVSSQSICLIA